MLKVGLVLQGGCACAGVVRCWGSFAWSHTHSTSAARPRVWECLGSECCSRSEIGRAPIVCACQRKGAMPRAALNDRQDHILGGFGRLRRPAGRQRMVWGRQPIFLKLAGCSRCCHRNGAAVHRAGHRWLTLPSATARTAARPPAGSASARPAPASAAPSRTATPAPASPRARRAGGRCTSDGRPRAVLAAWRCSAAPLPPGAGRFCACRARCCWWWWCRHPRRCRRWERLPRHLQLLRAPWWAARCRRCCLLLASAAALPRCPCCLGCCPGCCRGLCACCRHPLPCSRAWWCLCCCCSCLHCPACSLL
jgi:hypothetical protein